MPRKRTGRSTTHIRVPKKYHSWGLDVAQEMRETGLPPFPKSAVQVLLSSTYADSPLWNDRRAGEVQEALSGWVEKAIATYGRVRAKARIEDVYGSLLSDIVIPVPPLHGEWHVVLGVSPSATSDEVRAAHRKLSAEWHPDANLGDAAFCVRVQTALNNARDEYRKYSMTL